MCQNNVAFLESCPSFAMAHHVACGRQRGGFGETRPGRSVEGLDGEGVHWLFLFSHVLFFFWNVWYFWGSFVLCFERFFWGIIYIILLCFYISFFGKF